MKIKANKIDKFFELSNEAFESDNESVYEDLGISKEDFLSNKLKMIKRLKLKSRAQINKAKNDSLLEIALQKVQSIINSANEGVKEELERLILARSPQFQFRNIEKLEKDDIKELLGDLDVIDIIEDLEKNDNANQ
ncbi:hypothetical protein EV201_2853 [Ancylomarina subtilis]|uniref:Uncharacterized protein n=1 Tax=Ancylomarina subtilis TaxID=1639035 RepID=A0A4Q7V9J3_9BACT|nr:hypothetical protein [Ancylomarina subtilis]RZT92377.1 hypothetical protein EV201_2853 [Ancylomarina subtilis]